MFGSITKKHSGTQGFHMDWYEMFKKALGTVMLSYETYLGIQKNVRKRNVFHMKCQEMLKKRQETQCVAYEMLGNAKKSARKRNVFHLKCQGMLKKALGNAMFFI